MDNSLDFCGRPKYLLKYPIPPNKLRPSQLGNVQFDEIKKPFHLNSLYLREDSCKIGGCCSFVEIDVLHCIVLHYIVSSYVSIIVSTIGKTVVKLGFAVPLRCMPRCHAAACSLCPWL